MGCHFLMYISCCRFDVEKECTKIDGTVTKNHFPAMINSNLPKIQRKIDTTGVFLLLLNAMCSFF